MDFIKSTVKRFALWFISFRFPLILELFKWKIIDIYRHIKNPKIPHLYGIWCFVGIYGGGKTMSLVNYLERMRRKYGDNIYIATNFFYKNQDFSIERWQDLLAERDKPVIFAYDELQNDFNSREYKSFPVSLMVLLTQNRKGHGKQIVYTTQDYETVDKNFRRLTSKVVLCRTLFSRLTVSRYFDREDYEHFTSMVDVGRRMKIRPYFVDRFVQTDYLRNLYDSYQMLDSAMKKQYVDQVGI